VRIAHNEKGKKARSFFNQILLKVVDKNKILVDNNCDYQKDEKVCFFSKK
jgi:hypothetical protein